MFKEGNIVVRTNIHFKPMPENKLHKIGYIFKCLKDSVSASYEEHRAINNCDCRLATENEIKWFEAGITNINQIPEIGGTYYNNVDKLRNITDIVNSKVISNGYISIFFNVFINKYSKSYKPPAQVKSQNPDHLAAIIIFKIEDLKNCKIGNLTPEDHKIIQPWLFSLGYSWSSNSKVKNTNAIYLTIYKNSHIYQGNTLHDFNTNTRLEVKKETILNYIKQLNTNKDYEQINKKAEIKPESRTIRGSSIRIPVITGRIASASRLIGNKASGKCVKSKLRSFKVIANIITC
jgi:hypothetical protein